VGGKDCPGQEVEADALAGVRCGRLPALNWRKNQKDSQKAPYEQKAVAPKTLRLANSQSPAPNCAMPP
jgi:hypothetical protein